ncbi:MAG: hypothetical protein HY870_15130 [Chloroflexi bacterium]|nr:hypothetical protein [Chloroflexota bacterium]
MFTAITSAERRWLLLSSIGVLALASLPYLAGALAAGPDRVFSGLQVNPLDGLSYLAKMQIGLQGDWLFTLRYTAEQGQGALVYTYFIALGQLARILSLPLIVVFHAARLLGGLALLWSIYALVARVTDAIDQRRRAWWLIAVSSGLGWLALLLGHGASSDLTIPESNTFYSLVANAHFALATALMLAMFLLVFDAAKVTLRRAIGLSISSVALAVIQPFAALAVYVVLGATLLVLWRRDRSLPRGPLTLTVIAGFITAPVLSAIYLAMQLDPLLRTWLAQNQTWSPPPIEYVIGYGLLLVLAVPAAKVAWRRRSNWDVLLLVWIGVTALLLYAPISLQRRLSLGLHVPIGLLAASGLGQLARTIWTRRLIFAATLPTSIMIVVVLIAGAAAHSPSIYLTTDEFATMTWLHDHARFDDVVLAAPETSAFVPAFAGQRVVYGHPYETVDADRKKQLVTDFFVGQSAAALQDVSFVLIGARERALGTLDVTTLPLSEVFRSGDVVLYTVQP